MSEAVVEMGEEFRRESRLPSENRDFLVDSYACMLGDDGVEAIVEMLNLPDVRKAFGNSPAIQL